MPTAHVINHTHWDREWFLTHEYTTAWIPDLIDSLQRLASENSEYQFLFDGQSLVIEDLLNTRPEYREHVAKLIKNGNLEIGPVYSQPDWRMVSGELHLRNLAYGVSDAQELGGTPDVAWLVDTFGHISQAPQMLELAGVRACYVWRGVPQMTPLFRWVGADGTEIPTIDLFGGYRNLYGITKTPGIAVDRLVAEVEKLDGEYNGLPIPLFDGYDLDTEPEDPVRHYETLEVPERIDVVASSPGAYVDAVFPFFASSPPIAGELLSGKFGSTFPGSLSIRSYLKVLHHDAETAFHRRVEPLAALAANCGVAWDRKSYEQASRQLLQNGVHDCLCGVSIDQVHERMERSYRSLIAFADQRQGELAQTLLNGFTTGTYAVSTAAIPAQAVIRTATAAVEVKTLGVGINPVAQRCAIERIDAEIEEHTFSNEHYSAVVNAESGLVLDGRPALRLLVIADSGDTYSSEPGGQLGQLRIDGPIRLLDRSDIDTTIRIPYSWSGNGIDIRVSADLRFSDQARIDLDVHLDSNGTGFRLDAEFNMGVPSDRVYASMPFDVVERTHEDTDLLPHALDPEMAGILMGQRETGHVTEFPFHDFVALSNGTRTAALLAKGIRSYQSSETGHIVVTLRRSAEWLALTGLQLRSGDAGPMMYVPGARAERQITHQLALVTLQGNVENSGLFGESETFHNPPMIAEVADGAPDGQSEWLAFTSQLPLTGMFQSEQGETIVRLYNPHTTIKQLAAPLAVRSLDGADLGSTSQAQAKQILSVAVEVPSLDTGEQDPSSSRNTSVSVISPLIDRGGRSRSKPATAVLDQLDERIDRLSKELDGTKDALAVAIGTEVYMKTHQQYVIERELLELRLSRELNQRLAASTDQVSIPDEVDPVIAKLGAELNDLRVKRRIYDYVVQALSTAS